MLAGDVIVVSVDGQSCHRSERARRTDPFERAADFVTLGVIRDGALAQIPLGLGRQRRRCWRSPASRAARCSTRLDHSVPAAAGNAVTDVFPFAWESTKGVVKVLNPVNIVTHLTGDERRLCRAARPPLRRRPDLRRRRRAFGLGRHDLLLAVLNIFVGVFNMFPLLPLDGGHAAIAVVRTSPGGDAWRQHSGTSPTSNG